MKVSPFVFLAAVFVALGARAENNLVEAIYNQNSFGKYCGFVNQAKTVSDYHFNCPKAEQDYINTHRVEVNAIVNAVVFGEAADRQARDDRCLSQALARIESNEARFTEFKGDALISWLSYQKTKAIQKRCHDVFWGPLGTDKIAKNGMDWAKKNWRPPMFFKKMPTDDFKKLESLCLDEKLFSAISAPGAVDDIFEAELPLIGDKKVYEIYDKHRADIIDKKTGQPLTDQQIVSRDLRDLSGIDIVPRSGLDKGLDKFLKQTSSDRAAVADKLAKNRDDEPNSLRDYLYEQGAVNSVMLDHGMMEAGPDGKITSMTPAAGCIRAWYEPTFAGSMADLVIGTLLGGKVAYSLLSKGPEFANLSRFAKIRKLGGLGLLGASGPSIVGSARKNCLSSVGRTQRLQSQTLSDLSLAQTQAGLPAEAGSAISRIDFKPSEVPACKDGATKNYVVNWALHANCVREIISDLPYIGVPFSLVESSH